MEPGEVRHYTVVVEPDEDGIYIATVPSVPGVAEQGDTVEEALENLKDLLVFHLESLHEEGEEIPASDETSREVRSLELTV